MNICEVGLAFPRCHIEIIGHKLNLSSKLLLAEIKDYWDQFSEICCQLDGILARNVLN